MAEFKNTDPQPSRVENFTTRAEGAARQALPSFAVAAVQTAAIATIFRRKQLTPETTANFQLAPIEREPSDIQSYLGTPIFDQVQIQGGNFFEIEDVEGANPIAYEGIVIQSALMDISMSKNIVKTAIQGRDGTVKEYVSLGDYIINIQGNIIGVTEGNGIDSVGNIITGNKIGNIGNRYPVIDTKRLIQICKVGDSVEITSEFLQMFGISAMVITDFKFAQMQGSRNMQPFQITALSDTPINLEEL